uniref:Uncharacterized protein n=1 Tax=Avena sativa TaxID=4498 RepID=A0ACD5UG23_AVESA
MPPQYERHRTSQFCRHGSFTALASSAPAADPVRHAPSGGSQRRRPPYAGQGGQLLDLSEQELLDCDVADQNGCKGGYIEEALNWIKAKGGAVTEATYPYQARQGQCKNLGSATRVGKVTGARRVRGEPQMKLAVLDRPVGVLFDASGAILQNWKSGIYKGPCTTKQNHAVVLVGYGVSNTGEEYWIIKNSWGAGWGQNGFFFMRRGADGVQGLCGVAVWGTYPLM